MSLKKFSRGANYSEEEKTLLLSFIDSYLGILGNKKTDAVTTREKDRAWGMIADEYNAKSKIYRSKVSLKTCYDNLKKAARKTQAGNTQRFKTDGQLNAEPVTSLKKMFLLVPGPAMPLATRVIGDAVTTTYDLNAFKVSDSARQEENGNTAKESGEDVMTATQADGPEYIIGDPDVLIEPDGWRSSYSIKRSCSPWARKSPPLHPLPRHQQGRNPSDTLAELRLEVMREDTKRRRTREEEDYRTKKLVDEEEADIRIQILKTELLIKQEILKQEIKKTSAMDKLV